MGARIPGFKGEYLWELDIAERQLLLLAEAFPVERYAWRPTDARSVSEVLVHVAVGNFFLLSTIGIQPATDLYGQLEGDAIARMMAMVARNDSLEKSIADKTEVIALLKRSIDALRGAFTAATDDQLERQEMIFGEPSTVRRVYLRALTHMHEHMGQLIGYTRVMGLPAPWPDWRKGATHLQRGQPAKTP